MKNSIIRTTALTLFILLGAIYLIFGAIYLSAEEFMPYHSAAVEASWNDLNSNYKGLYLGSLKGLGAGAFAVGAVLIAMSLSALQYGVKPYRLPLSIISLSYSSLLTYATYTVSTQTPGEPPLEFSLFLIVFSLVASTLVIIACGKEESDT